MFLGTHTPKVDEKGRIILPAKFRPGLVRRRGSDQGQDRSLVLWPIAEFEAAAAKVREASQSNAGVRAYSRVLFSSAFDQVPDKQGRITVPHRCATTQVCSAGVSWWVTIPPSRSGTSRPGTSTCRPRTTSSPDSPRRWCGTVLRTDSTTDLNPMNCGPGRRSTGGEPPPFIWITSPDPRWPHPHRADGDRSAWTDKEKTQRGHGYAARTGGA